VVAVVLVIEARRVDVPAPVPPAEVAAACAALPAALPEQVESQSRRPTSPASSLTAAWGDPAIVLRCGVPRPAALEPTSEVVEVNGVEWFGEPTADGYVFTTTGRVANVEVRVPNAYAPEVNPLTDLAAAVTENIPLLVR
jgi:hypothetical protein